MMKDIVDITGCLAKEVGISSKQAVEIIESFFFEFWEQNKLLESFLASGNFEAISKEAHRIKGTAANLRMQYIAEKAALVEAAAVEGDGEKCTEEISAIVSYINTLGPQLAEFKRTHKCRVLIAEDNLTSGKILEQTIINLGHESMGIVSNAEQVLIVAKSNPPDIVFMDISLSTDMDGIQTAELLSGYYDIPVIFVSAYGEKDFIKNAMKYGEGYIVKPFTHKEVEDMMKLVSDKTKPAQEPTDSEPTRLSLKKDNKIFFIKMENVVLFEARGHKMLVHTENAIFEMRGKLSDMVLLDTSDNFVRPHRSYLVNRRYIKEMFHENYSYFIRLKTTSALIPVSKDNVKEIKSLFARGD